MILAHHHHGLRRALLLVGRAARLLLLAGAELGPVFTPRERGGQLLLPRRGFLVHVPLNVRRIDRCFFQRDATKLLFLLCKGRRLRLLALGTSELLYLCSLLLEPS